MVTTSCKVEHYFLIEMSYQIYCLKVLLLWQIIQSLVCDLKTFTQDSILCVFNAVLNSATFVSETIVTFVFGIPIDSVCR